MQVFFSFCWSSLRRFKLFLPVYLFFCGVLAFPRVFEGCSNLTLSTILVFTPRGFPVLFPRGHTRVNSCVTNVFSPEALRRFTASFFAILLNLTFPRPLYAWSTLILSSILFFSPAGIPVAFPRGSTRVNLCVTDVFSFEALWDIFNFFCPLFF